MHGCRVGGDERRAGRKKLFLLHQMAAAVQVNDDAPVDVDGAFCPSSPSRRRNAPSRPSINDQRRHRGPLFTPLKPMNHASAVFMAIFSALINGRNISRALEQSGQVVGFFPSSSFAH
jgi:hypothetical protein